ncbi:MAG: chromosome segregation protein SMC, partial [Gammaproteobacteria bacterium]|nr:chromosome segregation protein SMC [Gammaproteobacteria bacterium]
EQIEEQGWFVEQICQIETQEPLNTLKNKWTTLDKKFKEFGPVNLKALTEYQTESARAELLKTQREDLESASVALQHAMQLLEQEIQTLFDETYVKLRQEFAATFPLLFQGGSATLTLEPDLVTGKPGLIVHAQPPGKKNTRLSVLSGGEKALTAAALVFAFFQLNPAPFCILDEIDAPLDDPNTFRLGTMLESLKDRVQFIVVTHSKVMMQFADQLYGVTMKEPGVSRFVAVNKSSLETSAVQ